MNDVPDLEIISDETQGSISLPDTSTRYQPLKEVINMTLRVHETNAGKECLSFILQDYVVVY